MNIKINNSSVARKTNGLSDFINRAVIKKNFEMEYFKWHNAFHFCISISIDDASRRLKLERQHEESVKKYGEAYLRIHEEMTLTAKSLRSQYFPNENIKENHYIKVILEDSPAGRPTDVSEAWEDNMRQCMYSEKIKNHMDLISEVKRKLMMDIGLEKHFKESLSRMGLISIHESHFVCRDGFKDKV